MGVLEIDKRRRKERDKYDRKWEIIDRLRRNKTMLGKRNNTLKLKQHYHSK